jgi:hypothetical protein
MPAGVGTLVGSGSDGPLPVTPRSTPVAVFGAVPVVPREPPVPWLVPPPPPVPPDDPRGIEGSLEIEGSFGDDPPVDARGAG